MAGAEKLPIRAMRSRLRSSSNRGPPLPMTSWAMEAILSAPRAPPLP
jgi:hypothetical protein